MDEYAPLSLGELGRKAAKMIPTGRFLGVKGDSAHTYGYHRARAVLPDTDYSVQQDDDQAGDQWACSAVDIGLSTPQMIIVTKRLLDAARRNDPRTRWLAEFYGTTDGKTVIGWDFYGHTTATSDDSHLWHVHLGFRRRYATNRRAADEVYALLMGDEDDMPYTPDEIRDYVVRRDGAVDAPDKAPDKATNPTWTLANAVRAILNRVYDYQTDVAALKGELADMRAQAAVTQEKLDAVLAAVTSKR